MTHDRRETLVALVGLRAVCAERGYRLDLARIRMGPGVHLGFAVSARRDGYLLAAGWLPRPWAQSLRNVERKLAR